MSNEASKGSRGAALVTGGAIRLGKALSLGLAEAGYDIALHYNSSASEANKTADAIRRLGRRCELFRFDLAVEADPASLIRDAHARLPDLCVLVNSASVYRSAPIAQTDRVLLLDQLGVNLVAPFLLTRSFAAICRSGNVVNIVDNKIGFNQFHYAAYLLSKKALAEFTRMAALEFAPAIRVNGIAPGVTLPAESRDDDYLQWRVQGIPLKKQGGTAPIVSALRFILENAFVTGQIVTVDGGENIAIAGQSTGSYAGNVDRP